MVDRILRAVTTIEGKSIIAISLKNKLLLTFMAVVLLSAQPILGLQIEPDSTWVGQRIIMLRGFGEVNSPDANSIMIQTPNIVAPVARVEGNKVWVLSPGGVEPAGWLDKSEVILLKDAMSYFTLLVEKNPKDWDAYFRKADAEHALNKRDDAIADYTTAILLHPNDAYLYFRRARSYHAQQMCVKAIADYGEVIRLTPDLEKAADAYSRQAGIYANCADSVQQDPQKAIAAAKKAVHLDKSHPTYFTLLASAYARNGQIRKAINAQKKALHSPNFPPGYRDEATKYLQALEQKMQRENKSR
jgi:predicted Zn-dependent protease